jgi:hypothetical protein
VIKSKTPSGLSPKLRAIIEQLVAEAANGELHSQRRLDDLRKHPVAGRVIAAVLAEVEAAMSGVGKDVGTVDPTPKTESNQSPQVEAFPPPR